MGSCHGAPGSTKQRAWAEEHAGLILTETGSPSWGDWTFTSSPTPPKRRRTRELIETCGGRGRYAVGSGHSIPSCVPVGNYLAMVDEALGLR